MNKPFSSRLGELFAHIQDLTDTVVHTLLKRMNPAETQGKKNKLLGFFSSFGDSYFQKYTDIKKKTDEGKSS